PWQVCFSPEGGGRGGRGGRGAAPAAAPETTPASNLSEEEFQNKLMQIKSELHGAGNGPATLEDMLKGAAAGKAADAGPILDELRKENERLRINLEQARQRVLQFEKDSELWHT